MGDGGQQVSVHELRFLGTTIPDLCEEDPADSDMALACANGHPEH